VIGIRGSRMDQIILHGQESWALENTPEALANAIEEFCRKDLRAAGRIAARVAAERYSWARVFEGVLCIYREVCANYRQQ
jgi:glycosyltransferase involved in cell wall biosynthesis